jgi:hypothetical protein
MSPELANLFNGTRVARPVRTTMTCTWWRRLQLIRRVRPVLDDHMPRGQADEGGAAVRVGF